MISGRNIIQDSVIVIYNLGLSIKLLHLQFRRSNLLMMRKDRKSLRKNLPSSRRNSLSKNDSMHQFHRLRNNPESIMGPLHSRKCKLSHCSQCSNRVPAYYHLCSKITPCLVRIPSSIRTSSIRTSSIRTSSIRTSTIRRFLYQTSNRTTIRLGNRASSFLSNPSNSSSCSISSSKWPLITSSLRLDLRCLNLDWAKIWRLHTTYLRMWISQVSSQCFKFNRNRTCLKFRTKKMKKLGANQVQVQQAARSSQIVMWIRKSLAALQIRLHPSKINSKTNLKKKVAMIKF